MNSKHSTQRSAKRIKTLQMSYYVYIQCCNDVQMVKVRVKVLKHKWFFTGHHFLVAKGRKYCGCDCTLWYLTQQIWEFIKIGFVFEFYLGLCNLREICVSNMVIHLAGGSLSLFISLSLSLLAQTMPSHCGHGQAPWCCVPGSPCQSCFIYPMPGPCQALLTPGRPQPSHSFIQGLNLATTNRDSQALKVQRLKRKCRQGYVS